MRKVMCLLFVPFIMGGCHTISWKSVDIPGVGNVIAVRDWDFFGPVSLTHYRLNEEGVSEDGEVVFAEDPTVDLATSTTPMINAALGAGGTIIGAAVLDIDGDDNSRTVTNIKESKKKKNDYKGPPEAHTP